MIKLAHSVFDTPIEFNENEINILVIENCNFLTKAIRDLIFQIEQNEDGEFILSDGNNSISFKNADIITDIFSLDINNRKNINKLLSYLSEISYNENNYNNTQLTICNIQSYVEKIIDSSEYNLNVSDINIQDIFKISDIKFTIETENIAEMICDYISVMSEFMKIKLFIFLNLKLYISETDLENIYKHIIYNKLNVLLIESSCPENKLKYEKIKIIDKDLCQIT